ncbi:MAG: AAA family ATPase [Actinomycetota bacterium]|nr:AAA family ATPase [Actinomycetota bacterium]
MLLERETELGVLGGLLARLDSTGGKVVLIRGEAGIGKSSLVGEFIDFSSDEAHIHVGACDDLIVPQPLSPFWDMARVEPVLMDPIDRGDRPATLQTVLDLLSRSLRPTLMVIEDSQWADEATLDAVKYIGRRIERTNGLLLLTYRTGEVDYEHPLRAVIGDLPPHAVERIQLGGLSLSAISTILGGSDLNPDEVLAATSGNPFLVTEMASGDGSVIPMSLQDSVNARVQKLSPGAVVLLKTLSVIPEPIPRIDALTLLGSSDEDLAECERRGLLSVFQADQAHPRLVLDGGFGLEGDVELVGFRHDLIRRAVEESLTSGERLSAYRTALNELPETTHPCLLIECAREINDIDRLVDLAPRSAFYAAEIGSHRQAVDDFRYLTPHLGRFDADALGPLLDTWAHEEFLLDNMVEAIRLSGMAVDHYREIGDLSAESRALSQSAHVYENAGQRMKAEELASRAVTVLGGRPNGLDLARALETNTYLQWMAGNWDEVTDLVKKTLEAGGPDIDERILIRSLTHAGVAEHMANYPDGRARLEEARKRAEDAGQWFEECRALLNDGWAAIEFRDLEIAIDYLQRAIASAVRHELPMLEFYSTALYARALDLKGNWTLAEDLVRDLQDRAAIAQMVGLPVMGAIEARRGRDSARATIARGWELASLAAEDQRLAPAGIAAAEYAWITGRSEVAIADLKRVMAGGLERGFSYSPGAIAFWLWKLDELTDVPEGIAEPYRLVMEGKALEAAAIWESKGVPYDRGLALMHGDDQSRLEALELFESLGATAVAGKLRQALREEGVTVPRGKGRDTRRHAAGLTARQAEVLGLLDEGLTNIEIAERLFVSPRTVENHVSAVLTKLDSSTRDEAVSRARDEGLLPASA